MSHVPPPEATAFDVIDGVDLTGRRIIVTGGASGIGYETSRALARANAEVTLAVRNEEAGRDAARHIVAEFPDADVRVAHLDLLDQASIKAFAEQWSGPLHVLINNAGVMALQEKTLTPEGWEAQLAANHFGHAALALRLHDALAAADDARVVQVASSGHLRSPMHFEDLNFTDRPYDPVLAYAQSKTAMILFAVAAARRWAGEGIAVNALHPGLIRTPLQRHIDPTPVPAFGDDLPAGREGMKTREQGASTSVLLAASPSVKGVTGRYFEDNHEAQFAKDPSTDISGLAWHAVDPEEAERLWQVTRTELGI